MWMPGRIQDWKRGAAALEFLVSLLIERVDPIE